MSHPELGKKLLDHVAEQVGTIGKIEAAPKLDGRNMIMVLAPDRRAAGASAARTTSAAPRPPDAANSSAAAAAPSAVPSPSNGRAPGTPAPTTGAATAPGSAEET